MLTKKICGGRRACCAVLLLAAAWFSGCAPPGPRALINGEKLIAEGRYAEAVESLQKATRLLPRTPQAWNHLGLAYQGSGQLEEAARAYRTALSLDHRLAEARYNLGCLLLEQNNLAPALDELTSYTLVHPEMVEGWLRLGSAYLKARRPDYAERCFKAALDLRARHPEALNGMGMVQFQRRRWQEAANYFNAALAQDANFAPALLNAGITAQQGFNNRPQALQKYRQYLALQPTPAGAEAVESAVRQLEAELNPTLVVVPSRPAVTGVVAQLTAKTNALSRPASNPPASALITATRPTRPTPVPATSTIVRIAPPVPVVPTNPTVTASAPARPAAPSRPVATNKPAEIEVTQVTSDLVVKPPQELGSSARPVTTANRPTTSGEVGEKIPMTNTARKGLLTKLNPFSGRNKSDGAKPTTLPGNASANPASVPVADNAPAEAVPPVPPPPPPVPRYTYLSPLKPTAGNRVEAEMPFSRGLKAQQEGRRAEAIREYQAAMRTDPAYFDAYYNLGLAALDNGDSRLALWAYEIALSIKPDSADARYNLGLALKAGGFHLDALEQLEKAVQAAPGDARPHLSLANLYAQQFRDNSAARRHYQKVLELNPRHPEAPKIRYWLAANP